MFIDVALVLKRAEHVYKEFLKRRLKEDERLIM